MPASPMPFTPSPFVVDGVTVRSSVIRRDLRRADGTRYCVIDDVIRLPVLVVDRFLVQRLGDPLGDAAVDLPVHDHRVDHVAAVVDRHVPQDLGLAGLRVDLDDTHVGARGPREVRRVVDRRALQASARRRPAARARATRDVARSGIVRALSGAPFTRKAPSAHSRSSSDTSSSCAAIVRAFSFTFSTARRSASPPTAAEREPYVSMPDRETAVSPCSTSTSSGVTPSPSATICDHDVSCPCPCGEVPVRHDDLPERAALDLAPRPILRRRSGARRGCSRARARTSRCRSTARYRAARIAGVTARRLLLANRS